ncbi:hypothetical protein B0T13DRAFT_225447 [Neurospora crassa]|nr:hypothetical protein B0T13DRAFT_225447 [Neurospora crassa]
MVKLMVVIAMEEESGELAEVGHFHKFGSKKAGVFRLTIDAKTWEAKKSTLSSGLLAHVIVVTCVFVFTFVRRDNPSLVSRHSHCLPSGALMITRILRVGFSVSVCPLNTLFFSVKL